MGHGPVLLFLHGAGGASHSWRDVMPELARSFRCIAIDLPGHGLTQLGARNRSGLQATSQDVLALCRQENWPVAAVIGHSAGGAVALRMAQIAPDRFHHVIGINPALGNFKGLAGLLFPAMAKVLAATPFTADLFSRSASKPDRLKALLKSTGSQIDAKGEQLYAQLVADRDHVDGTLMMMAQWSLDAVASDLGKTNAEVLFIAGAQDKTVPPSVAQDAAKRLPRAEVQVWADLGHLLHEEAPVRVAGAIQSWLKEKGLLVQQA